MLELSRAGVREDIVAVLRGGRDYLLTTGCSSRKARAGPLWHGVDGRGVLERGGIFVVHVPVYVLR